ncbi:unnamed protein product [Vicia faba]|uniref:non-specific serine/threonine protein kinase n=1 Tax=Vicia faba TaxID=3906 RepID=A0AAV0YJU7_VICFA|nr:unnamed protein product [Vicia faba]
MRISMTCFLCFAIQVLVYYMLLPTNALSLTSHTDKLALLALKDKLTNGVPDSLPSWNESLSLCEWQGVACGRRHMRVSVLHLENQTWGGTLGPSLGNLTFLRILKLKNLALHGEIPVQIGRLKRLQVLILSYNKLQGEIPVELTNCTNIEEVNLMENKLIGRIPTWFGSMKQLIILNLVTNSLVGTIPSSLQNISSLQMLYLTENHLEGTIPYSLGGVFSNVTKISLIGNKNLCGGIPQLKLPPCFKGPSKKHKRSLKKNLSSSQSLRVTYGELHEATNGFSSSNLVGTGSFGSVYKGSLLNIERPVAITRVKISGYCFRVHANGSLENLLHNDEGSKNHSLGLTQRVDIALDVAHALDYLHHDEEQVVVHCDIKPSNVLLDEEMVAHLGDFGLARLIHGYSSKDQVSSSTIKGTIGYIPPEYGAGGPVTPEGDIYSYGIMLLEMITGKRPTDNMFCENFNLHKLCKMKLSDEILQIVDSRLVMPFIEDQTWIVENNIKECLMI